jgi:hypothetical protein
MRRLLRVELTRWRSRPLVVTLALGAVLLAVVAAGLTAWESRPLSDSERADAAAQSRVAAQEPGVRAEVAACRADPAAYLGPTADRADCVEVLAPGEASFLPREPLALADVVPRRGVEVALVVVCLMLIAGSTFAGADWASRAMLTQLTVEPRRGRVWLGKALAVAVGAALTTAVALLAFWGVLAGAAQAQDLDAGSGAVTAALAQVGRATALAAAAALGGFALTMVLRHTVATLALVFLGAVGGEIALGLLPWRDADRWSVGPLAADWVQHASTGRAFCESACLVTDAPYLTSGLVLGGLTLLAVAISLVVFRRRDV